MIRLLAALLLALALPAQAATVLISPYQFGTPLHARPLSQIISTLGLGTGLQLALDAGDSASYSSGQSWLDTSGGGYDFFLGTNGSANASDPTFNGTPGGLSSSEFWSFDGGDYFTYDTTNESWMDDMHQAGAVYTLVAWVYVGADATNQSLTATRASGATGTGIVWYLDDLDTGTEYRDLTVSVRNAGSSVMGSGFDVPTSPLSLTAWEFVAFTGDATGTTFTHYHALDSDVDTLAYSSPSAGGSSATMTIAASGGGSSILSNGSRMAMFAAWSTVLLPAQIKNLYVATKGRFE